MLLQKKAHGIRMGEHACYGTGPPFSIQLFDRLVFKLTKHSAEELPPEKTCKLVFY